MKKFLLMITGAVVFAILLSLIPPFKGDTYTLTEGEATMLFNTNVQVKQILPTSQAPAYQVTQINYAIDSIQKVIATQFQKFHPDTVKTKK